jgi:DUF2892 family protein
MYKKRRIHDGLAGAVIFLGVLLAQFVDPLWILLPGIVGVTMLQSAFSGFCPLYYILDKIMPEK